jgi:hypothetical protein
MLESSGMKYHVRPFLSQYEFQSLLIAKIGEVGLYRKALQYLKQKIL